jgi:ATPase subunit of ABC transporter with duplicated ATPase domains
MVLAFEQYKNQQRMIEAMKEAIKRFCEWGERGNNERMFRKARSIEKRLEKMEKLERPQERAKLPIAFTMGERSGKRALTVDKLNFSYGADVLFNNAGLEVFYKDKTALLGDNGTGKTTLIQLILGRLQAVCGGVNLAESARIGYIEQEISFKDENATVLQTFRDDAMVNENEARRQLARYYIRGDEIHKRLSSLSGGERVILKLAMLMRHEINLLILDEPTNHLDIDTKELLEEALADYKGTLLFISHDRYFINKIASKIVRIEDKRLVCYNGNYDDYLNAGKGADKRP